MHGATCSVLREAAPLFLALAPTCAGGRRWPSGAEQASRRCWATSTRSACRCAAAHHPEALPANLAAPDRGLHSMPGPEHASRRRITVRDPVQPARLATASRPCCARPRGAASPAGRRPTGRWGCCRPRALLAERRAVVFPACCSARPHAANEMPRRALKGYFLLRWREASSRGVVAGHPPPATPGGRQCALTASLRCRIAATHRRTPSERQHAALGRALPPPAWSRASK